MSLIVTGITAAMQAAVNQVLGLDQHAKQQFQQLAGKVLAVEFTDLPLSLFFVPTEDELQIFSYFDGVVDTRLRGTSIQMMFMGGIEKPGDSLFKGSVDIEGDTELGQRFQEILRNFEFDWEEHLSHVLGDVAAHKLGNAVRGGLQWVSQAVQSVQTNFSEYLQYESDSLPARFEVDGFAQDVDVLRNDVERLSARMQRLSSKIAKKDHKGE